MKRNPKPRWRKSGGGVLTLRDGQTVEPNQVFRASAEDIPEPFRDSIQPIDGSFESMEYEEPEPKKPTFAKAHKGGGRYIVYNTETNKVLTEEYLSKDEADALIESGGDPSVLDEDSDEGKGDGNE